MIIIVISNKIIQNPVNGGHRCCDPGNGSTMQHQPKSSGGDKSRAWNLNSFLEILTPPPVPTICAVKLEEVNNGDDVNDAEKSVATVKVEVKEETPDVSETHVRQKWFYSLQTPLIFSLVFQVELVENLSSSKLNDKPVAKNPSPNKPVEKFCGTKPALTKVVVDKKLTGKVAVENRQEPHRKRKKLRIEAPPDVVVDKIPSTTILSSTNTTSPGKENRHDDDDDDKTTTTTIANSDDNLSPTSRAKDSWSRQEELRFVLEKSRLSPLLSPIRDFPGVEFKNGRPTLMCRLPLSLLKNVPPQSNLNVDKVSIKSAFVPVVVVEKHHHDKLSRSGHRDLDDVPISKRQPRQNSKCHNNQKEQDDFVANEESGQR